MRNAAHRITAVLSSLWGGSVAEAAPGPVAAPGGKTPLAAVRAPPAHLPPLPLVPVTPPMHLPPPLPPFQPGFQSRPAPKPDRLHLPEMERLMRLSPAPVLAGLHILLVEDDPDILSTTVALLTREGVHVTAAETGDDAIALLDPDAPLDLVLSDVMLPGDASGMDVVDAARRLRPAVPALLSSGHAAPEDRLGRARPEGVGLLLKPYRRSDLIAAIGAAVTRAPQPAR